MQDHVRIEASDDLVEIEITGKLTKQMYEDFVPLLDQAVRDHGKLRVLFVMRDFHGWTAGALWEDVKFDLGHFRDISRLALVGDKKWQHGMAVFCRPFTTAEVKYFPSLGLEAAREWLKE